MFEKGDVPILILHLGIPITLGLALQFVIKEATLKEVIFANFANFCEN